MSNEEMLGELLDKIQRNVNGIDLYSLPRAVLCELIRCQNAELAQAREYLGASQASIVELAAGVNRRDAEIAALRAQLARTWQPVSPDPVPDYVDVTLCRRTQPAEVQP